MDAIRLENVKSYRPAILDSEIKSIANRIVKEVTDFYLYYGCRPFKFECANGIRVDVEVRYNDENGGSVKLEIIEVTDTNLNCLDDEAESIGDEIDELLEAFNYERAFSYNADTMSKKDLYAEYNL